MNYEEAIDNLNNMFLLCPIDCAEDCEVCRIEAVQLAIEALEKQIPKKPIGVRDFGHTHIFYHLCPACEQVVYEMFDFYCSQCGQKLTDWNEVE